MRILIHSDIDDTLVIKKFKLSFAGHYFVQNLLGAIPFDFNYSLLPLSVSTKVKGSNYVFSSLRKCKLTKLLGLLMENFMLFAKIPSKADIYFYNITLPNCILYFCISFFRPKSRCFLILLDFAPSTFGINALLLRLMKRADGVVKLSNKVTITNRKEICLPGIVPNTKGIYPELKQNNRTFLLSGMLNDNIAMLEMVLRVFASLPSCQLILTGQGDETLINNYTSIYKNIVYKGLVNREEFLSILYSATFCLSTRNPDSLENLYNFPSKMIEGLLYNRILISTIDYSQLGTLNYFKVGHSFKTLKRDIERIANLSFKQLQTYSNQSSALFDLVGPKAWMSAFEFLEDD